jgi:hypothetical protein
LTDYQTGFAQGEAEAWRMRAYPLPKRPRIDSEKQRGFWDARLPRNPSWAIRTRVPQTWRDAA